MDLFFYLVPKPPQHYLDVIMAHRHIHNTSHIFEAEPDQQWNHLPAEDPYLHFARADAIENVPITHTGENGPVDRAYYASQWNSAVRLNGYSSSHQMVITPHYQPDAFDFSHDLLHPSPTGNVFMVPENHVHHASSSNLGATNNYFDISMSNGMGPYKRKSPGIPTISERGGTSRYYCAGSSSDLSSSSELGKEKSTVDAQHTHLESLTVPPSFRTDQISMGGESSMRNVRSRSALDLGSSDVFRTHVLANHSHLPTSSRPPIDQFGSENHPNQNFSVPIQEWNPIPVSGAPHGRPMTVSSNLTNQNNHLFPRNSVTNASEMARYHHEHVSSRNPVIPQSLHPTPSHRRGFRSSYTHISNPNHRFYLENYRMSNAGPSGEGLQLVEDSHSSRYPRPAGRVGWRNGDMSGRSRLSSERHCSIYEDAGTRDRLTPEGLMIVERSSLYRPRTWFDQHREMMLDVDNMSYEELLALGERIGSVSTGLCEDQLPKCLTETVYCSSDQMQEEGRCVICLDNYEHMDDVGTLKACGHDYHVGCIKKWLSMKNICPICKGPALQDNMNLK